MVCWCKPPKKLQRPFRNISATIAGQIMDNNVLPDFGDLEEDEHGDTKFIVNHKWSWLPTVVCDTCRNKLRNRSEKYFVGLKRGPYAQLRAPRAIMTRAMAVSHVCDCSVCLTGRLNILNNEDALAQLHAKQSRGRPGPSSHGDGDSPPTPPPQIVQVCTECWIQVAPGMRHPCTKTSLRENLLNILEQAPPKTKEQVLTKGLKEVFAQECTSQKGGALRLSTGGQRMTVTLGTKKTLCPPPYFSLEVLNRLQLTLRLSDKKARTLAGFLRIHAGRKSVEANQQLFFNFILLGQSNLKVMMTIKSKTVEDVCSKNVKRRRSLYRDGFQPMAFKDAGVKKLIVLAMSPCKETHENVETLMRLMNITYLEFAYSTDIKMILLLLGIY